MKKKMLALFFAAVLAFSLLAGCGNTVDPEAVVAQVTSEADTAAETAEETTEEETPVLSYQLGDHVEDFTVTLCDGTTTSLSEMLETKKAVMINIWATWCGPCGNEFPVMNEAYEQYQDQIGLLCLSPYDDNEAVAAYKEERGLTLPMGEDTVGFNGLVLEGYPTTIIIDRFGNYVYYECGSITDVGGFTRMWDTFLSDDYTESTVYEEIPGPKYEGELPSDADLTAALSPDGSVSFTCSDDEYAWPFLPAAGGAENSNALQTASYAEAVGTVSAKAGDVLRFDYDIDTESLYDYLTVLIDGEDVKYLSGTRSGSWAYQFENDGEYSISLRYDQAASAYETETSGRVSISNVSLLSGDEADAALAALPDYPFALEGDDYALEVLSEDAKQIVFNDPDGKMEEEYGSITAYLIPGDTGRFRMLLGDSYDPDNAYGYGDDDGIPHVCSDCEMDDRGYIFECSLADIAAGSSYCDTYVSVCPDANDWEKGETLYIFASEENVNYFLANDLTDSDGNVIEGITWQYADGTQPSTDAIAENSEEMYNIYIVDENGDPVDGVKINLCTDETCTPTDTTDGYYGFTPQDPCAYTIHVISAPEGYTFDPNQEYTIDENGGTIEITVSHS